MGIRILRDQATQSEAITINYYDICTLNGRICPSMWENFTTHLDHVELKEEEEREREERESDWDADIEDARDYRAKVPLRRPK